MEGHHCRCGVMQNGKVEIRWVGWGSQTDYIPCNVCADREVKSEV